MKKIYFFDWLFYSIGFTGIVWATIVNYNSNVILSIISIGVILGFFGGILNSLRREMHEVKINSGNSQSQDINTLEKVIVCGWQCSGKTYITQNLAAIHGRPLTYIASQLKEIIHRNGINNRSLNLIPKHTVLIIDECDPKLIRFFSDVFYESSIIFIVQGYVNYKDFHQYKVIYLPTFNLNNFIPEQPPQK